MKNMINYIKGDLIKLALEGKFDVIGHGVNCFCAMKSGIAPQMDKAFNCGKEEYFSLEIPKTAGDINKLGQIESGLVSLVYNIDSNTLVQYANGWIIPTLNKTLVKHLYVVNAYTQYWHGRNKPNDVGIPLDYDALRLCMRKINHNFKGLHIGLPKIGCGLAGGDWEIVSKIIEKELTDMKITVVEYEK